jgi:putative ABC transport system substrate-binding protein
VIDRRTFLSGLAAGVLTSPLAAQTPPAGRIARIGILTLRRPGVPSPYTDALMQGLRELGYVEGRNLVVDYPDASAREDRLPALAAELVRGNVDLILVIGPAALAPARRATTTVPLVMVGGSADPVAEGVAASLSRPGGNVTGLTYAEPDRFKKQLELLKSVAPRASRIGVLWDFDLEVFRREWAAPLAEASRTLGLTIQEPVRVGQAEEIPAAFARLRQRQAEAILVAAGGGLLPARATVAELAIRHRLPAIAAFREFPQAGLLMSYGPDLADINRRAAAYVNKILKGARPGELPIELPSKFDLVINRQTAKSLGLAIPQELLLRATEVVQ